MIFSASDPLALVAINAGQVGTPTTEAAAAGSESLDTDQRSIVIGEPVPIAFCRRRNGFGGILVSPGASECRFENDTSNAVTAYYLLVVSEGQLPGIQVRDVYQGLCRVGSHSQTYNRRAGTWEPGNFLANQNKPWRRFFNTQAVVNLETDDDKRQYNLYLSTPLTDPAQLTEYPFNLFTWYEAVLTNPAEPDKLNSWSYKVNGQDAVIADIRTIKGTDYKTAEASSYCGSKGAYPGMTTVSFRVTIPNGFDVWKKQVHFFLRGGMQMQRLADGQTGPSDNFCDLARWMMLNSGRWPAALIGTEQLTSAAAFLEANAFTCNCWITESSNYLDYLAKWAPLFLLCESNRAGKRGLRPILPVTSSNEINTGAISPVFTFAEDNITPGSLEIEYTSLADRRPFVVQAIWRQQLEDDFGIIRTAEVRLPGTAANGPYESHDLSEFCTRENHAVKVAAHILARRVYTTHSIRFTAKPQANNTAVTQGDIIRVRLERATSSAGSSFHDYLYQVQRITKTLAGELSYEAVHFPVDSQGRSLIALAVANTGGTGVTLTSNRSGLGCDLNSATDTTVPEETFSLPDLDNLGGDPINLGGGGGFGGGGSGEIPLTPNPDDGYDGGPNQPGPIIGPGNTEKPVPGGYMDPGTDVCGAGGPKKLTWYLNGVKIITYEWICGTTTSPAITYENPKNPPTIALPDSPGVLEIGSGTEGKTYTSVVECCNGTRSGREFPIEPNQPSQPGYVPDDTLFKVLIEYSYASGRGGSYYASSYKEPLTKVAGEYNGNPGLIYYGYASPTATEKTVRTVVYDYYAGIYTGWPLISIKETAS